jgi:hypothetical protein
MSGRENFFSRDGTARMQQRYRQFTQLAAVDAMLSGNNSVTKHEMASACGCSARTVTRIMNLMRTSFGVTPMETWDGRNRRYIYAVGQSPIFSREIGRRLRQQLHAEAVA